MSRLGRGLIGVLALGAGAFGWFHWATAPEGAPRRATTQLQVVADAFRRGELGRAAQAAEREVSGSLADQYTARLRLRSLFANVRFDQEYEWAMSVPGIPELVTVPGAPSASPAPAQRCETPAGFAPALVYLRPAAPAPGFVEVLDDLLAATGRPPAIRTDATWPSPMEPGGPRPVAVAPGVEPATAPPPSMRVTWLAPASGALARLGKGPPTPLSATGCVLTSQRPALGPLAEWRVPVPIEAPVWRLDDVAPEQVLATLRCDGRDVPGIVALSPDEVMFAFDVLAAIVHLRQGDPAQAGQENDNLRGLRPSDLFTPPRDRARMMTPHADLLAEAVLSLVDGGGPRFGGNPAGTNGTLVLTADQDFAPASQIVAMMAALRAAEVPATFFLTSLSFNQNGTREPLSPSPEVVARAQTWGFDFGAHTFVPPDHPEFGERAELIAAHARDLQSAYGLAPIFVREHGVQWSGYVERAREFIGAGYRWEANYMTVVGKNLPTLGYMTGSGRPLRLYDEHGTALPLRQVATQLDDHPDPQVDLGASTIDGRVVKLSLQAFQGDTLQLVAENARHFHGALVLNNHPIFFTRAPDWLMRTVAAARASGQAVMSFAQYVRFQEGLLASDVRVDASGRVFDVCAAGSHQELVFSEVPEAPVLLDGNAVTLRRIIRFGRPAAALAVPPGAHRLELPAGSAR